MAREAAVFTHGNRLAAARHRVLLALLALAMAVVAAGVYYWPEMHLRTARAALGHHQYDVARASLLRYLEARPGSAEAHLLLAQLDRRANHYGDAGSHLDACRRLGGSADEIELERALMAIQNGVYNQELAQVCDKHLNRHDDEAREYLILEALSQGFTKTYRLKEALVCLDRMLVLQPDSNYADR